MLAYLLVICVSYCAVAATLVQLVSEYLFSQKVDSELKAAEEIALQTEDALYARNGEALYAIARTAPENFRVLVLDLYGVVQADSQSESNGTVLARREVAEALVQQVSSYGYYFDKNPMLGLFGFTGDGMMTGIYAIPVLHKDACIGALVYISYSQEAYASLQHIRMQMMTWLILIAVIVASISLFISKLFTKPIASLNDGIAEMSRGDFSYRVKIKNRSEFGQLAEAFNSMCERIENLDKTRSQFVSNASHELKTPLSTIKILIETLMYEKNPPREMLDEFLSDINKEIDRLNNVINDLLTLVSLDSKDTKPPVFAAIQLSEVLSENVRRLAPLARERGIEMSAVMKEQVTVDGDVSRLTQVFYNLIDNAIKYTPRGGTIKIELAKSDAMARVRVIDSGIGIPAADLPHVFDRFYRVDKARSRGTGGTGLGLSIVKQIVLLHNGKIDVTSEVEKGSTFTVELPISTKK